jgi:glucose-6-phosphate dehydrogenase assembly protein OpcA
MPGTPQSVLLDDPREVDVVAIERELTQLWKRTTESEEEEHFSPLVRACALNLLVVTDNAAGYDALAEMVAEVTVEHPSRTFMTLLDRGESSPSMEAWISARCSLPFPGEKQVCCEQIALRARGSDTGKIPSVITSLLVANMPTVLVWTSQIMDNDSVLQALVAVADRVLIDSSCALDTEQLLKAWERLLGQRDNGTAFGDLAWTHAAQWRGLLAQAFQPEDMRQYLAALERVTVEYSSRSYPVHSGLSQSLLLLGWLSHVLKWKTVRSLQRDQGGQYAATTSRDGQGLALQVLPRSPGHDLRGGIEAIAVTSRLGMTVRLEATSQAGCVRMRKDARGRTPEEKVLPIRDRTEADLLASELEELHPDDLYLRSMQALARMLDRR